MGPPLLWRLFFAYSNLVLFPPLQLSPDGEALVTGGADKLVKLWG
jgi:WD40 repeat protein